MTPKPFNATSKNKNYAKNYYAQVVLRTTPQFLPQDELVGFLGAFSMKIAVTNAISPADARQLSVYALLFQQKENLPDVPATALLYPTLNASAEPQKLRSWNGADLHLWPVCVAANLADAILAD